MQQLRGGFSAELEALRAELLKMASLLELELDFSEEEVEFADRGELLSLLEKTQEHVDRLAASFRQGNLIKNGIPVAIVGAANAGKSTLLNALLGEERAIVTDIPGTTRDTIEETFNLDGLLFRFIDTAGIRESSDTVEKMGIERTFQKIAQAEIVLALVDMTSSPVDLLNNLTTLFSQASWTDKKVFLLLNKSDQKAQDDYNKNVTIINNFVSTNQYQAVILKLSAKTKEGIPELKKALVEAEKDLIPNADSTFITNVRHFEALQNASQALSECRTSLSSGIPSDLVAEDLRRSLSAINSILGTGLLDPETILHNIFKNHCIGK